MTYWINKTYNIIILNCNSYTTI